MSKELSLIWSPQPSQQWYVRTTQYPSIWGATEHLCCEQPRCGSSVYCEKTPAKTKRKKRTRQDKQAIDISFIPNPQQRLDSDIITVGLNLISKQFPEVQTQDCLLLQRPKCLDPILECNHGDFCQILHMRSANHWVAMTNIAADGNDVRYFDSLDSHLPSR